MIPLLDIVERTANVHVTSLLRTSDRLCDVTIAFNGRREWINAFRLPGNLTRRRNAFYVLGSNLRHNRSDSWHFVDFQHQRDEGLLRLGMAPKRSFDTLRVISDALDLCDLAEPLGPFSYNPVKVDFGVFVFHKHVGAACRCSARIPSTCSSRGPSCTRSR